MQTVNPSHLWYSIGLIVTDGNLSKSGRHINITSKDGDFLEDVKKALGLTNKLVRKTSGYTMERKYFMLQFGDINFYNFLLSINLTPKKSLTLKDIKVPPAYFHDFVRGVIDGDGSVYSWEHPTNFHTQWNLSVVSGAPIFINWLKEGIENRFLVKGKIYLKKNKHNPLYMIRFGKMAAKIILKECYYEGCLCLERKSIIVKNCLASINGFKKYGNVVSMPE